MITGLQIGAERTATGEIENIYLAGADSSSLIRPDMNMSDPHTHKYTHTNRSRVTGTGFKTCSSPHPSSPCSHTPAA